MGAMDGWVDLNNITRPQQYHSIVQGGMAFRHELGAARSRRGAIGARRGSSRRCA